MTDIEMTESVAEYIARIVEAEPTIEEIWMFKIYVHGDELAVISPRFDTGEHIQLIEKLGRLLWAMPRPLPSVQIHGFNRATFEFHGENIRETGTRVYQRES